LAVRGGCHRSSVTKLKGGRRLATLGGQPRARNMRLDGLDRDPRTRGGGDVFTDALCTCSEGRVCQEPPHCVGQLPW
jgi:hypothetical protein